MNKQPKNIGYSTLILENIEDSVKYGITFHLRNSNNPISAPIGEFKIFKEMYNKCLPLAKKDFEIFKNEKITDELSTFNYSEYVDKCEQLKQQFQANTCIFDCFVTF